MTKAKQLVITGANRGIGLALAEHYNSEGWQVTAIVRSSSVALRKIAHQVIEGIQLDGSLDVSSLLQQIEAPSIDLLLNVAGIMQWESLEELQIEGIRRQIEVNTLAPLMLTHGLLPKLNRQSKVAFLTSRLGSISDNNSGKGYGYRMSKAALNMAVKTLAIDLHDCEIAVGLLHPGSVKTSLNKLGGQIEISESVAGLTRQIAELNLTTSGHFIHQNGQALAW